LEFTETILHYQSRIKYSFIDRLTKGEDTNIHKLDFTAIKNTLQYLEDEKKLETLKKVKGIIIRVLKYAFKRDIVDTAELIGKLELYEFKRQSKKQVKNNPTLTSEDDIKKIYNDMLNYSNNLITRYLLIFTIHTAQR
jgi:integrase